MTPGGARAAVLDVAALLAAAAAAALAVHFLPGLDCIFVAIALVAIAWPIWCHEQEQGLFVRRVILAGALEPQSPVRRWLWAGPLSRALLAFASLGWAAVVLVLGTLATPAQWIALFAAACVLGLALRPAEGWLARDVRLEHRGVVARRWPLLALGTTLLALAFFAIDYYGGAPDTRSLDWQDVAAKAFGVASAQYACAATGALAGAASALDALSWHAAQILIPSLGRPWLRAAGWLAFLLQAGLLALGFMRLLLGVASMRDRRGGSAPPWKGFAVVVALAALTVAVAYRAIDREAVKAHARSAIAWADPCRLASHEAPALRSAVDAGIAALRAEESRRIPAEVSAALDPLFAGAESRVDAYLDWYFTILAEYMRLAAAATGGVAAKMQAELEARVFGPEFDAALQRAGLSLSAQSRERVAAGARGLAAGVQDRLKTMPCLAPRIDLAPVMDVQRDLARASVAAAGGASAGIVTAVAARRVAGAAAARAAGRGTFKGAASLVGRAGAKRGGTALVAALGAGAACGPLAPLCALAIGGATWIALDKAFIEVDELRLRDAMRAEIVDSIRAERAALEAELAALLGRAADEDAARLHEAAGRMFIPARDGATR